MARSFDGSVQDTLRTLASHVYCNRDSLPLSPSLFLFSEAIDSRNSSSECLSPDSTPVTSICSHWMGTLSALNTVLTDSATSAPIPSPRSLIYISSCVLEHAESNYTPGIRVVVYFPPYLVGLNISDCTVAIAIANDQFPSCPIVLK